MRIPPVQLVSCPTRLSCESDSPAGPRCHDPLKPIRLPRDIKTSEWPDTGSNERRLVFRYRASSRSYLLNGDWTKLFRQGARVEGRGRDRNVLGHGLSQVPLYGPLQGCLWHKQCGGFINILKERNDFSASSRLKVDFF
ncbi:hypothetical protein NL676_009160 [Syzygium grande]|nr:hypothetical protein NL676_009160 [Syzygium grande]